MFDDGLMTDTTTPQPEAPALPSQSPPLVRPREGRVIAGVAAGLARRLGIGTGWVRAGFVVASFFGGSGVLLYILGWLAIPEEGADESIASSKVVDLEGSARWIGVGLIVLGGLLVLGWTDAVNAELVWAGALVLAGILLYRGDLSFGRSSFDRRAAPPAPPPPQPPPMPVSTETETEEIPVPVGTLTEEVDEVATDISVSESDIPPVAPAPPPPPPPPPPAPVVPKPRAQRSILGRLTLATMLVVFGVMAILDNAGVADPAARHYVGALVGVAGVGLLAGAWWGRSRGLIAVGILLLPVLFVASVVRVPFSGEFGEKDFRPATVAQVRDEYRLGAGDLVIDLTALDFPGEVVDFKATVGAGRLTVIVPPDPDIGVAIDGRVGFGELDVLHVNRSGVGRKVTITPRSGYTSLIDMEVETGFGELIIVRGER
jgi:phage shock protein PspC (stress-responsive transcriptional regulator)